MFDWENKIKKLNEYNIAFEIKQGYYHISISYNPNWSILLPENKDIYVEERNGIHHYIALIDKINIDDIFKCIDETINYNKDFEKKLALFKEKTEELQEIFAREEYNKLTTIEFTFPPQKKSKTKKQETKKKQVKDNKKNQLETINKEETTEQKKEEILIMKDGEYIEELERK